MGFCWCLSFCVELCIFIKWKKNLVVSLNMSQHAEWGNKCREWLYCWCKRHLTYNFRLHLTGWGRIGWFTSSGDNLNQVGLVYHDQTDCHELSLFREETMLCMLDQEEKGVCKVCPLCLLFRLLQVDFMCLWTGSGSARHTRCLDTQMISWKTGLSLGGWVSEYNRPLSNLSYSFLGKVHCFPNKRNDILLKSKMYPCQR